MAIRAATCSALRRLTIIGAVTACAACASLFTPPVQEHSGSAVDYLYPSAKEAPRLVPGTATLRPPVRIGIAFAPGGGANLGLSEAEQLQMLERVKAAFAKEDFIGTIEVIPSQYLRPRGGFDNLEQVARMFNVELVALVSYDQMQFTDNNALSVLYWTIVGAYVIHGDQYDVQTLVDAAVFDVASRKLLLRAPGTSQIKGSSSLVKLSEASRDARRAGYEQAVDALIPNLQAETTRFRERLKTGVPNVQVVKRDGYGGGGLLDFTDLAGLLAVCMFAWRTSRRAVPSSSNRTACTRPKP